MELGGNISLENFDSLDHSTLIVIKKIVGNYVKKISTSTNGFEKLHLILNNAQDRNEIKAKMTLKGNIHLSEALDSNLFFALDNCLSKLQKEI